MTASYIWPKDLNGIDWIPSFLWEGYTNTQQDVVVRSEMDSGPGVTRRRFSGYSVYHTGKTQLTSRQLLLLDSWYSNELMNGALSFLWCPPGMYRWYEARFRKPLNVAPNGAPMTPVIIEDGDPLLTRCPKLQVGDKFLNGSWIVTFEIEQMPGDGILEPVLPEDLTATDDEFTTPADTALTGDVGANDTIVDGCTFTVVTQPTHGTLVLAEDGTFTYTPTSGYQGTDSFTYKVCQPAPYAGNCATGRVTITVGEMPGYNLTVTKSGAGTGLITSDPAGVNYGDDNSEIYPIDSIITLTAVPDAGSTFVGWTGDATANQTTCQVVMIGDKTVNAEFGAVPVIKPDMKIHATMLFGDGLYAVSSGSMQSSGVRVKAEWSRVGSGTWTSMGTVDWTGIYINSHTSTKSWILSDPDAPTGTTYLVRFTRMATWYRRKLSALQTAMQLRKVILERESITIETISGINQNMNTHIDWTGDLTTSDYGLWVDEPSDRVVREVTTTAAVL